MNVPEGLKNISEERIKVRKEEAGTSVFYQAYDKFHAKQYKAQTRHILEMVQRKVHAWITQWNLIMIVSIAI